MRLAVVLPSLEGAAPESRSIDAMMAFLRGRGHEIEGFAEHDRSAEGGPVPVYHYLRLAERHTHRPFATALYPLGRDATPYQSVFAAMRMFPGVVWFLDPVVHHLALGGIALMEDWAAYREFLARSCGASAGAVAQTVASNWGTGALFRRHDLVDALAAGQSRVLAAWPALAERVASRLDGKPVDVVPLGVPWAAGTKLEGGSEAAAGRDAAPTANTRRATGGGAIRRLAIMTVNDSYATTAVRAAAAALGAIDNLAVTLCLSEPIYKAEGRRVAHRAGIQRRVDWQLTTSPAVLEQVAADADVLVWLSEELQGGHRLLLLQGMAAGKITVVPRCALYADLPDGCVAQLDLGGSAAPTLAALLQELVGDAELAAALRDNGSRFAAASASVEEAGRSLEEGLEAAALDAPLRAEPVSAETWSVVLRQMEDASMPSGAAGDLKGRFEDLLRAEAR